MEKQRITRQDIRQALLVKINKAKKLSIFLTIVTVIAIPSYILFILNFANIMVEYTSGHLAGGGVHPAFGLVIGPFVIVFFVLFLLNFYYIDLYKATTGRFLIIEEKLYQKKEELITYYRRTEKENSLYFRNARVPVEDEIYSQSTVGDNFYVIILRAKKVPLLVYNTKYYEIEQLNHVF